ncbi:beta/gamma crystallin domain-containing protein 1 [Pelodytes ibericus]
MEKEKKGFLGFGRFFSKNKADEHGKGGNGSTKETTHCKAQEEAVGKSSTIQHTAPGEATSTGDHTPGEVKKKTFGSWRSKKRRSWASVSTSPTSSPGPSDTSDRSFEIPDGDPDLRTNSMFITYQEDFEATSVNQKEPQTILNENPDKSKSPAAESPRKDGGRKPVLGKFGNIFNTSKRKQSRSLSDSPTSPTKERAGLSSKASEKDPLKERKRNDVTGSLLNQTSTQLDPTSEPVSKEATVVVKKVTNGKSDNGLYNESHASVKETETQVDAGSLASPDTDSCPKPILSPSPKTADKQISIDRNVKSLAPSLGRKPSATEGEAPKVTSRKLQVFSQEIKIGKEESPKPWAKKSTKFSGKLSDSKLKIPDNTEDSNTTKVSASDNTKDQASLKSSTPQEAADGRRNLERVQATGDISPSENSPGKNRFRGSVEEKSKTNDSNESAKVLTFDIYLSKTSDTQSPAGCSNGESMEKSPSHRRSGKKKRPLKSQSSQNGEKKTDCFSPQDQGFDNNFSFEGVTDSPTTPEHKTKPVSLSPEANGISSTNQDSKAGANHKISPKGESDKDKQQHPASSYWRRKKENQSATPVPASPTARKAQAKDSFFRNQAAAFGRAVEGNQPGIVSTTKDSSVEKRAVLGVSPGNRGEDGVARSCEITEECTSPAAGALSEDRSTQQGSNHGGLTATFQSKTDVDCPTTQSPVDLDVTTHKTSVRESTRSTITSKLNIPPKPKNVELPIEHLHEPIHRGNIANKISLFENKKTSHRQIDFPATKNISQPKKYVERAKLNFGKQLKGPVHKSSSSTLLSTTTKQTSDLKTENGFSEVKLEAGPSPSECAKNKADSKKKESLVNQEQMEDTKHGLDTVITTNDAKAESVLPLIKADICEEDHATNKEQFTTGLNSLDGTESKVQIDENNLTKTSESLGTIKTQDDLSRHPTHSYPNSDTVELDSKGLPDMGNVNKYNSMQQTSSESNGLSREESSPDNVDLPIPTTLHATTDTVQSNNNKEVAGGESEPHSSQPAQSIEKSRTKETPISRNKSPSIDTVITKKDKETQETIETADAGQSHFTEQSSVRNKTVIEGLKPTKPLTETGTKQSSVVEDGQEKQLVQALPMEDGHLIKNEESTIMSTDGPLKSSEAITPASESCEADKLSLVQETSGSTSSPVSSALENSGALKEEVTVLESGMTQNEETSLHVSTSNQECGVGSLETNPHLLEETDIEDTKPNETPLCKEEETILSGKLDTVPKENPNNDLKHNENELKVEVGDEVDGQRKDNSQNILITSANADEHEVETINGVHVQQFGDPSSVDPQDVKVSNERDVKGMAEMGLIKSSEGDTEFVVHMRNVLVENDQVESVSWHSNGNPQTAPEQYCNNMQGPPENSFNVSVASDENILDSSSDMEKFAETIRKLDSPVTQPQKRKKQRAPKSPGPYCGLPSIREDYLEKILDNDAFSFGLGKKERARDMAPMALFKLQSREIAEKKMPKRASAEQSMLLKSLKSHREPFSIPQETCEKENADVRDLAVKRSRIESMYSGLKSPSTVRSEENVFSPSVTTLNTITTSFATPHKECALTGKNFEPKMTDSSRTAHTPVNETEEDLINATGSLAADYLHNLHTEITKESQTKPPSNIMEKHVETKDVSQTRSQLSEVNLSHHEVINASTPDGKRMPLPPFESTPVSDSLNANSIAKDLPEIFYFKGQDPSLGRLGLPGQGVEKINPRPGKLVILTEGEGDGTAIEVFTDLADCTSWELSPTICIKTIRGCWILHELPNFQGKSIALEEGELVLTNPWGEDSLAENTPSPTVIGSLRHVVKDYRVCQIDLFTEPDGLGIMTSYLDDTEELQVYGRLQKTCSIKVHWGVWLVYEEPGFQGIPFIIEPGEYPNLSFWDTHEAYIGSIRPLKMGSRKVEIPYDPKIIIYEKPMFEGQQLELEKEILKLEELGNKATVGEEAALPFTTVGSMRVLGGLWVGYEKPGFEGHQYLLEEGDYEEWPQWSGYNEMLQSLRPILSDFSTPHITMYSEKDFDEKGPNINVLGIISNMEETGFGVRTQSINVLSGVWVAYETPDFTGEQYILEKGMYRNFSDWGAKSSKISSVQPILLDAVENPRGGFKVELFSEPDFQGNSQIYEEDTKDIEDSFTTMSCRVISGRWAMHDKQDFSGNLWVLEEGHFPNLCSMGCQHDTVIRSLQTVNYEFSEPSIVLYGKENYKGRKVKLTTDTINIQAMGYSPDLVSLEVIGGVWVLYEYSNYRGRQAFILPSKIPQWNQFNGWDRIGSLRPLRQKRLYFKLRNKGNGMLMSTNGSLDDIKLLRIQVMEDTAAEDQIWVYQEGTFRCRIAEDCSLATSGSLVTTGSKLGLALEQTGASMHWSVGPDGRIYSSSKPNFVLDIKGGNQYDQQHVILHPVTEGKLTQLWEICVL